MGDRRVYQTKELGLRLTCIVQDFLGDVNNREHDLLGFVAVCEYFAPTYLEELECDHVLLVNSSASLKVRNQALETHLLSDHFIHLLAAERFVECEDLSLQVFV